MRIDVKNLAETIEVWEQRAQMKREQAKRLGPRSFRHHELNPLIPAIEKKEE